MESQPAVGCTAIDFILVGRLLPPHEYRFWGLGIYRRVGQLGCLGKFCSLGIDCRLGKLVSLGYFRCLGINRRMGQFSGVG